MQQSRLTLPTRLLFDLFKGERNCNFRAEKKAYVPSSDVQVEGATLLYADENVTIVKIQNDIFGSVSAAGRQFYGGKSCNGWRRFLVDSPDNFWDGQTLGAIRDGPGFLNTLTLEEARAGPNAVEVEPVYMHQQRAVQMVPAAPVADLLQQRQAQLADRPNCTICLEAEPETALACGHAFHAACIMCWATSGATTCPHCRVELQDIGGVAVSPRVQVDHTDYDDPTWDDALDDEDDSYDDMDNDPDWNPGVVDDDMDEGPLHRLGSAKRIRIV